jgi:nucleoid-associated protein YgaU
MLRHLALLLRGLLLAALVAAAVVLAAALTLGGVSDLAQGGIETTIRGWTLDRLLVDLASAGLLAAVTGFAMMSALAVAATLSAPRAPGLASVCSRVTPRPCRRVVAAVLGLGLTAPVLMEGSAGADPGQHVTVCRPGCHSRVSPLDGLAFPDLPSSPAESTPRRCPPRQVVVRRGDSLWGIADERLTERASAGEIATLTWRLYALNRAAIGDDPNLIYPGMTIATPKGRPCPR